MAERKRDERRSAGDTTGAPDKGKGGASDAAPPKEEKRHTTMKDRGLGAIYELAEGIGIDFAMQNRDVIAQTVINWAAKLQSPLFEFVQGALNNAPTAAKIFKVITPHGVPILGTIDDLAIDIGRIIVEKMRAAGGDLTAAANAPATATSGKPAPAAAPPKKLDRAQQACRIVKLVPSLTPKERDNFLPWYRGLTPDQQEVFLSIAAEAKDEELKSIMLLPAEDLDDIIALAAKLKEAPMPEILTYLDLRSAIEADAALQQKVAGLAARFGADKMARFWKAVGARVSTLKEFRALLALNDDEISAYLKLDSPPAKTPAEIATAISDDISTVLKATPTDPLQNLLESGDPAVVGSKAHADSLLTRARAYRNRPRQ